MRSRSASDNPLNKIIGANINRLRTQRGMSQTTFGSSISKHEPLSAQQISKYELGEDRVSATLLVDFAGVLECSVADLLEGIAEQLPSSSDLYNRTDMIMMQNYRVLPAEIKDSVRIFVGALAKEMAGRMGA